MSRESKATKEEIQRNRDEAYQNGWGDGYAEGFGKATEAAIAALPARGVGVPADVKDYAIDVSEAFDTMMEVERNPAGAWQAIQALAGHIAALAPTDAAQAREAAIRECASALRKVIDYAAFAGADPDEVDDEAINSYADYLLTLIDKSNEQQE